MRLLEIENGQNVGRHPDKVTFEEYAEVGIMPSNPVKVIRAKCLDCCAGAQSEVRMCTAVTCPLWPYRMGSNPLRSKREMTDEEKQATAGRLKAARLNKKLS